MADRPSLLNLDQSQADLQNIQSKMRSEMSNFENQTVQQTRNAISSITNELKNLQNSFSSESVMGPLKSDMEETLRLFQKFKDVGEKAIGDQRREIESFTNNVSQMYEAIKKSYEAMQQFNSVKIGDVQQVNDFQRSISNLKNSFEDFVSTSDIINLDQTDLDVIKQRMMEFLRSLSMEGTKAFNLAEMMTTATQDPALKMALTNMLIPLNEAIAQIPNNVIDSFAKTQNQMSGGSGNIVQELINSLNSFSGIIQSQVPGTGMGMYDPQFAQQQAEAQRDANAKASQEAENATVTRLSSHLDKMFSSANYASNVDKNLNKMGRDSVDLDAKLDKLFEAIGGYSKGDMSKMNRAGIGSDVLDNLRQDSNQIQKLLSHYEMHSDGAASAVNSYKKATGNYEKNSSPENLQKLIESEKKVKEEANLAAEALDELMNYTSKYVADLDLDTSAFKNLPGEMKDVLLSMNDLFNVNIESGSDLLKLYEAFGINIDKIGENLKKSMSDTKGSLNEMNREMSSNGGFLSGLLGDDSKLLKGLGMIGKVATSAMGGFTGYYNTLGKMGLNPGMPTSLNDMFSYVRGGTDWYQKFGQMDYQAAMAQNAQGGGINQGLLQGYHDTGKEIFAMSKGQIKNDEYYGVVNKLLTQVQGHYGEGNNKSEGMSDMNEMSKMALMIEKVYGVDSVNTINSFYKELGMGTEEVTDLLGKLTQNAEMANIPINQYVKAVSEMSVKFKQLGVDIKIVENGMRNFTMEGMSFSMAQDMTGSMGNAVNRFTDNPGQMAVYGMLSGQFSSPWEAMWTMSDRWDENGNIKEGATDSILKSMGTQIDYMSKIWGGNEYAQRFGVSQSLQQTYGLDQWQANVLTNKYLDGDYDSFSQLLEKYFMEGEEGGGNNLEQELQTKIEEATSQLDELTKAQANVAISQQNLADQMQPLVDILVEDIDKDLKKLHDIFGSFIETMSGSDMAKGLMGNMNWLGPLSGGLFSLGGALIGGKVAGKVIRKGAGKVKSFFSGGSGGSSGVAGAADDIATATLRNGDDVLEVVTQGGKVISGSADEIAQAVLQSGDEVVQLVTDGGQLMWTSADELATTLAGAGDDVATAVTSSGDDIVRAMAGGADEILIGAGSVASKFLKAAPALGALIDGVFAYNDSKKEGSSTGEALADAAGSAVGTGLGGWGGAAAGAAAGAAIGSVIPIIGTAAGGVIGGIIGGVGGGWAGGKLGKGTVDLVQESMKNSPEVSTTTEDTIYYPSYLTGNSSNQTNSSYRSIMDPAETARIKMDSESNKKLLEESRELKTSTQAGYSQANRNAKDQLDALGAINETTDSTTKSINELYDKTNSLERTVIKKYDEQTELLKNDGIKIKSMPSTTWSGRPTSTFTTSDGTTFDRGQFTTFRDELNAVMNNKNNNTENSILNSGSGGTISRGTVAGKNVDQVLHQNLTSKTDLSADDINDWIASKTSSNSKMRGMGEAFIKASEESGLDPLYLVSHAALETGWGTSSILNDKNNWFGIGAFDSSPYESAYGFNNLEAGIVEGAKWISKNYTFRDKEQQNTLYKMVNAQDGWHNYATDPGWARKIASIMITGAGGEYQPWDGTGYSGGDDTGGSDYNPGKSFNDLVKENTFGSTIFKIGSPEWSNGSQKYNIMDYKNMDFGENSPYVFKDSQAMARVTYLDSFKDSGKDAYKSTIEAYDDKSTAYNKSPEFKININVNGEGGNYEAMAQEMKSALSNIALQYMGSSSRIASANYERVNSQY